MTFGAQRLEATANILIIALVLFIGGILVKREIIDVPVAHQQGFMGRTPDIGSPLKLPAKTIDWSAHRLTIVLALNENCQFCTQSAGFYKQLADLVSRKPDTALVAIFRQPPDKGRIYLESLGINISQIIQCPLAMLGITGTPTLVFVDRQGIVRQAWAGKLTTKMEKEVMSLI